MEKILSFDQVPDRWAVCLMADCPKGENCLRRRAALLAPQTMKKHTAVMPAARKGETCSMYVSTEPVRMAWGMTRTFQKLKPYVHQEIQPKLEAYFGSHTTYYRYFNGLRPISPKQQAWVAALLQKLGKDYQPQFDREEVTFDFTT